MLLLKGLIIGFAIAAPVGPIGVLCIQRSLENGFRIGLATGLGAAAADGVYGLVAGFGLTAVADLLVAQQFWIRILGGLFLLYLGFKLLLTPTTHQAATAKRSSSWWPAFGSTFLLTITNPMTILSFMAVFAGLGLGDAQNDYQHALLLITGIVLGSSLWWIFLSAGVTLILKHRVTQTIMRVINWTSAVIILLFGIWALQIVV